MPGDPKSARENEQLAVRIESEEPPHRRMVVRQITGLIARRIVCWLKPGDVLGGRRAVRDDQIRIADRIGAAMRDGSGDHGEEGGQGPGGFDDRRPLSGLPRRGREFVKRTKMFAVLPTLLTLGNAACGFGAITFAAKVGPDPAGEHDLFLSAVLIFLAMLFDMLDGSVARWAKQTSEFGAQLDSLCDAMSFGVAPGLSDAANRSTRWRAGRRNGSGLARNCSPFSRTGRDYCG